VARALCLLAAAWPESSPDELEQLSIGRRDDALLKLREQTFGPRLVSLAACPECGKWAELEFDVSQIRAELHPLPSAALAICTAGWNVQFRLPNSLDVAAIADRASVEEAQAALLERCLLAATPSSDALANALPPEVASAIAERMSQAEPQADVQLACSCPQCGQYWQAPFDIVTFFWTELHAWSKRTLREVHLLASAYGWGEAEILALGPARRQSYLELVSA